MKEHKFNYSKKIRLILNRLKVITYFFIEYERNLR